MSSTTPQMAHPGQKAWEARSALLQGDSSGQEHGALRMAHRFMKQKKSGARVGKSQLTGTEFILFF